MIASPLIILLLVPLAAIVFILLKAPAQQTAAVAAGLNLVLSLGLLFNYPYQDVHGGYAYVMNDPWVPLLNGMPPIRFHFGVDGISLPLVFLTAIVTFAAIAISPGNIRRANEYYCYLLIMSLGAMGAFISLDLFFFYIFHEFALIPTFLLYRNVKSDPIDLPFLARKFYIDEFYERWFVEGQQYGALFLNWIDSWILDGLIIRGSAYVSLGFGEFLRLFQTGSLQGYAFLFSIGGVLFIYFTLFAH